MNGSISKTRKKRMAEIRLEYAKSWHDLHAICEAEGIGAECTRVAISDAINKAHADGANPMPGRELGYIVVRKVALQIAGHLPSKLANFFAAADEEALCALHRRYCAVMKMRTNHLDEFDPEAALPSSRALGEYRASRLAGRYRTIAGRHAEKLAMIEATIGFSGITADELINLINETRREKELISQSLVKLEQELRGRQAASGGTAKSDKLQPIRDYCRDLYQQQPETKPHQTKLKAIRERVIEYAKERGDRLSYDQFIKTASGWVADLRK